MATTARDICKSILRKLHVLGQGQNVSNDELNDVLENVNDMLAIWSVEGNLVYTESSDTFNLTAGQATYTVGTSQDFDTARILRITSAYTSSSTIDYPLADYEQKEYAGITDKTSRGIPQIYYYNGDYPIANLSLYPVPSGVSTITINSEKELTSFADLDTVYALPPEYKAAIIYNGAVWMAAEYEKEPTPSVNRIANRTKKAINTQNSQNKKNVSSLDTPVSESSRYYESYILRGY